MSYLIAAVGALAAAYFAVRFFLLRRSLRMAAAELKAIAQNLEENRVLKLEAADLATAQGIDVIVTNGRNPHVLYDVMDGKKIGTLFVGNKED